MTDWSLLSRLALLVMVAAIVGVPAQMRAVAAARAAPAPSPTAFIAPVAALAAIGLLAAAVGTAAASRVGLQAQALDPVAGALVVRTLARHLGWGLAGGLSVAVLVVPFYYGVMRPLFDPDGFIQVETVRRRMGLPGRIAVGGVLEEVVYRWGALALFAWVGLRLTGEVGAGVQWGSILGSALLFGLGHLPGGVGLGVRMGPALVLASLAVNGLLGIVAGWLVWHQGLLAAMAAHASVHVAWSVVEVGAEARGRKA